MANFGILRFAKLKTSGEIQASSEHSTRTRTTKNADPARTHLNRQLIGNAHHILENINYLLWEAEQKRKIRPDANKACEIFLGASPEWFRNGNLRNPICPERIEEFVERCTEFLQKEFGDHCISAVLHLDETTPHIHAHFVPLHRGTEKHKKGGWLSWDDWFGNKFKMQKWQDKFAEYVKPVGLERGIKGSIATHEDIQDFYGRIQQDLETVPDLKQELALPMPEPDETAENYHRRLTQYLNQKTLTLQEEINVLAAHAANEEWEKQRAQNATLTNQAVCQESDELKEDKRQLELNLNQEKATREKWQTATKEAIAQEMIATAESILNHYGKNYLQGERYIFSRRRGATKIDTRDGRRLVSNEGGQARLTEAITQQDVEQLRQIRQQASEAIATRIEQQEKGQGR